MLNFNVCVYERYELERNAKNVFIKGKGEKKCKSVELDGTLIETILRIKTTTHEDFELSYIDFCEKYGCLGVTELRVSNIEQGFFPIPEQLCFETEKIDHALNEIILIKKIALLYQKNKKNIETNLSDIDEHILSKIDLKQIDLYGEKEYFERLINGRKSTSFERFSYDKDGDLVLVPVSHSLVGYCYWELVEAIKNKEKILSCLNCGTYFISSAYNARFCDQGKGSYEHRGCENRYNQRKRRAREMYFKKGRSIEDISKSTNRPQAEIAEWINNYNPRRKTNNKKS